MFINEIILRIQRNKIKAYFIYLKLPISSIRYDFDYRYNRYVYEKQTPMLSNISIQNDGTSLFFFSHLFHFQLQSPIHPSFAPFFSFLRTRALSGYKLLISDARWGYWFFQRAWQCRIHATVRVASHFAKINFILQRKMYLNTFNIRANFYQRALHH